MMSPARKTDSRLFRTRPNPFVYTLRVDTVTSCFRKSNFVLQRSPPIHRKYKASAIQEFCGNLCVYDDVLALSTIRFIIQLLDERKNQAE